MSKLIKENKVSTKKEKTMIGFKGFDKDLKCRSMQYEVGKTKTHRGSIELCSSGLHFVENPFDILSYYPLVGSRFAQVEAEGVSDETESDSKRVAKKLTTTAELNLKGFIEAGVKFIFDKVGDGKVKGETTATSGNRANSATSGYGAHSATSGFDNGIACSVGRKAKAKASKGCFIVLAEWYEGNEWTDSYPLAVKSAKVDDKKIKADQWYKLVDGKFVETDDSNE